MIEALHDHEVDAFNRNIAVKREVGLGDPCVDGRVYTIGNVALVFFLAQPDASPISNEALLAVVLDRLRCFQRGARPCRENALAVTKLEEALHWLGARSRRLLAEEAARSQT